MQSTSDAVSSPLIQVVASENKTGLAVSKVKYCLPKIGGFENRVEDQKHKSLDEHVIVAIETLGLRSIVYIPQSLVLPDHFDYLQKLPTLPEVPADLVKYRTKFESLQRLMEESRKTRDYNLAQRLGFVLAGLVKSAGRFLAVEQYLDICLLISQLNQVNPNIVRHLYCTNRQSYIDWHMRLARALEEGTEAVERSLGMALFCYRRAADAGDCTAKITLVKKLWLHDASSENSIYLPEEALRYIAELGHMTQQRLEGPEEEMENIVMQLVMLTKSPDETVRAALAQQFLRHGRASVRNLAATIYIEPQFGSVMPERARLHLGKMQPEQKIDFVKECYWRAKLFLVEANSAMSLPQEREEAVKKAVLALKTLQMGYYPAAIFLLAQHYVDEQNSFQSLRCVTHVYRNCIELVFISPDLANALSDCTVYSSRPKQTFHSLLSPTELKNFSVHLLEHALRNCHPDARLCWLMVNSIECLSTDNFKKAGTDDVMTLPEEIQALMYDIRFSSHPTVQLFIYVSRQLHCGCGGESLVEAAMRDDPVTTCCILLCFGLGSATRSKTELIATLLNLVPEFKHLPRWCRSRENARLLLETFVFSCDRLFGNEWFLPFFTALYRYSYPEYTVDDTNVPDIHKNLYADFLLKSGDIEGAEKFYRLALTADGKNLGTGETLIEADYQLCRQLDSQMTRLLAFMDTVVKSPAEARGALRRIIELEKTLNGDPEGILVWVEFCNKLLTFSPYHLLAEEVMVLVSQSGERLKQCNLLNRELLKRCWSRLLCAAEHLTPNVPNKLLDVINAELLFLVNGDGRSSSPENTTAEERSTVLCEWARLPGEYDYLSEHHLVREMEKAVTPSERLDVLKRCLKSKKWPICKVIELWLRDLPELQQSRKKEAVCCLSELVDVLQSVPKALQLRQLELRAHQVVSLHRFLEESNSPGESYGLEMFIEQQQAELARCAPKKLAEQYHYHLAKTELLLYEEVYLISESFAKQCTSAVTQPVPGFFNYFLEYTRGRDRLDEDVATIYRLVHDETHASIREQLIMLAIELSDSSCRDEIVFWSGNHRLSARQRVHLLTLGLEINAIGVETIRQLVPCFAKNSCESVVLKALALNTRESLLEGLETLQTHLQMEEVPSYTRDLAYLLRPALLRRGATAAAYQAAKICGDEYALAMLEWKHHCSEGTTQVASRLLCGAANNEKNALYRLADQLIECPEISELTRMRCYRYLHMPVLLVTPERKLYQGLFQFLGIGCKANSKAIALIHQAINDRSPVPSFRLFMLIECQSVLNNFLDQTFWTAFVHKLNASERSWHDEWLLECGPDHLQGLVTELEKWGYQQQDELRDDFLLAANRVQSWYQYDEQEEQRVSKKRVISVDTKRHSPVGQSVGQMPEQQLLENLRESLVLEIDQLLVENRLDSVVQWLKKLHAIQGGRFLQELDIDLQAKGLESLFVAREPSAVTGMLCRLVESGRPEIVEQLRGEIEASLEVRTELRQSSLAGEILPDVNELGMMLMLLPDTVSKQSRYTRLIALLTRLYMFDMPEILLQFLQRNGNRHMLKEPVLYMQRVLLGMGKELAENNNLDLLETYCRCRFYLQGGSAEVRPYDQEEMKQALFHDLPSLDSDEFRKFILSNPLLSDERKVRLFNNQPVELKRACLVRGLPDNLFEGYHAMALAPRRRSKAGLIRRQVELFFQEKKVNIQSGLELCLATRELAPEKHQSVAMRLLVESRQLLSLPLNQWLGHPSRIWAMVVCKLAEKDKL